MKNVIIKLSNKCKDIANSKKIVSLNTYNEIVDIILNSNFEEEKVKELLVELYRFGFYSEIRTSLDPRGDVNFKTSILIDMKDSLKNGELTDDMIQKIREENNFMRSFIDNPVEFIEDEIKFYIENPGAKF